MSQSNYYQSNKRTKRSHHQVIQKKKKNKNIERVHTLNANTHTPQETLHDTPPNHPTQPNLQNTPTFGGFTNLPPQPSGFERNLGKTLSLQNLMHGNFQRLNSPLGMPTATLQPTLGTPHILQRIKSERTIQNQYKRPRLISPIPTKSHITNKSQAETYSQQSQSFFLFNPSSPTFTVRSVSPPKIENEANGGGSRPRKIFNFFKSSNFQNPNPISNESQLQNNLQNEPQVKDTQWQILNQTPFEQQVPIPREDNSYLYYKQYKQQFSNEGWNSTPLFHQQISPLQPQLTQLYQPYQSPNFNYNNHNQIISPYQPSSVGVDIKQLVASQINNKMKTLYDPDLGVPERHIKWLLNLNVSLNHFLDNFINPPTAQSLQNSNIDSQAVFPLNQSNYAILQQLIGQQIANNATTNIYLILDTLKKTAHSFQNQLSPSTQSNVLSQVKIKDLKHLIPYFSSIKKWRLAIKEYLDQLKRQDQILKQRNMKKMQQKLLKLKNFGIQLAKSKCLIKQIQKSNVLLAQQTKSTFLLFTAYQTKNKSYRYIHPDNSLISTVKIMAKQHLDLLEAVKQLQIYDQSQQEYANISHYQIMKMLMIYFTSLCGEFADLQAWVTPRIKKKIAQSSRLADEIAERTEEFRREQIIVKRLRQIDQIIRKKQKTIEQK